MEDELDDNDTNVNRSKSGVGVCANINTSNPGVGIVPTIDEEAEQNEVKVPQGLDSNFDEAPYWRNETIETDLESYMLSVNATFRNMDGLRSTPQYGFSRGISKFKKERYDDIVSELSNNLIGMNAVDMLDKKQITKIICINALSYLIFLKRKRI